MVAYTNEHGLRDVRVGVATAPDSPPVWSRILGWALGLTAAGSLVTAIGHIFLTH